MDEEKVINFSSDVNEALDICHYGTKGQKWGERKYQNPDGTWTEIGKKRRRGFKEKISHIIQKKRASKAKESSVDENEKKRQRALHEKEKNKAIQKGKASDIEKFKYELTKDQKREVLERLKFEEDLKRYADKESKPKTMQQRLNEIEEAAKSTASITKSGIDLWNDLANIYNSSSNKEVKLPVINN